MEDHKITKAADGENFWDTFRTPPQEYGEVSFFW